MTAVPVFAQTITPCTTTATPTPAETSPTAAQPVSPTPTLPPRIIINELIPNPVGVDTDGEFIEIRNTEQSAVDITGWKLTDSKGKAFVFLSTQIMPNGSISFSYATTKLTLVNTSDTISLLDANGAQIDQVFYSAPKEGESYARDTDRSWRWTNIVTPGAENIFPVVASATTPTTPTAPVTPTDTSSSTVSPSSQVTSPSSPTPTPQTPTGTSTSPTSTSSSCPCAATTISSSPSNNASTSIGEISDLDAGSSIVVQGIVSLPPGIIGNKTFAIQNDDATTGIMIRNWTGPALLQGMTVLVRGKIRKSDSATWIALDANGTQVVSKKFALPDNEQALGDISENDALIYTTLAGAVAKTNKKWFTVTDNQGTDLRVRYTTSFTAAPLAQGNRVNVHGVITMRGSTPEVLVLNKKSVTLEPAKTAAQDASAPVADPVRQPIVSQPSTDFMPYVLYGGAFALVLAAGLGYTYWRRKYQPTVGDTA